MSPFVKFPCFGTCVLHHCRNTPYVELPVMNVRPTDGAERLAW